MKIEIDLWGLMGKHKMTATKLAEVTWLTPVQISHIKNGRTSKIELKTLEKLLEAFNCEPNDLIKITRK